MPANAKCTKVIGAVPNAGRKLPNCLFSRTETGLFFAVIVTGKGCKIVPQDFKRLVLQ